MSPALLRFGELVRRPHALELPPADRQASALWSVSFVSSVSSSDFSIDVEDAEVQHAVHVGQNEQVFALDREVAGVARVEYQSKVAFPRQRASAGSRISPAGQQPCRRQENDEDQLGSQAASRGIISIFRR